MQGHWGQLKSDTSTYSERQAARRQRLVSRQIRSIADDRGTVLHAAMYLRVLAAQVSRC